MGGPKDLEYRVYHVEAASVEFAKIDDMHWGTVSVGSPRVGGEDPGP